MNAIEIHDNRPSQGAQFSNRKEAIANLSASAPVVYWRINRGKDKNKFALVRL